jgi:hypothetical protein
MRQLTQLQECPICGAREWQPVLWLARSGEPHGEKGHNVTFSTLGLDLCKACGHAVLESHSHDCWSHDEEWNMYWWYVLTPTELARLQSLLASCPAPLSTTCECPVHASLRQSGEKLYAGVRSQPFASRKVPYAWVQVELSEGAPRFKSLS